jgi:hypothetical protein
LLLVEVRLNTIHKHCKFIRKHEFKHSRGTLKDA